MAYFPAIRQVRHWDCSRNKPRTPEACREISQGYAFFAYPWDGQTQSGSHPERVSRILAPFRVLFLVLDNRGLRSLPLA